MPVPQSQSGDPNNSTRAPEYYESTYQYLSDLDIPVLQRSPTVEIRPASYLSLRFRCPGPFLMLDGPHNWLAREPDFGDRINEPRGACHVT